MDKLLQQLLNKEKYSLNDVVKNFQDDIPASLYKYRSFYDRNNNENDIENKYWKDYLWGKFHLNTADNFEDVNDCKPFFDKDKLINAMIDKILDDEPDKIAIIKQRKNIIKNNKEIINQIDDYIKKVEKNYKNIHVGCFTNTNKNDEMWEKYADNYQGLCIEYDTEKHQRLKDSVLRVCYVEEEKRTEFVDKTDIIIKFINNLNYNLSTVEQKNIFSPLFIKTNKWSFEKEYRLFLLEHRTMNNNLILEKKSILDSDNNINLSCAIKAIYLGKNFKQNKNAEKLNEEIIELAKEKNISVYKINENNEAVCILNSKK